MTVCKFICPIATVEHNSYIGDALLLILIGIQRIRIASAGAPVDGMRRIAGLVFSYAEELRAGATGAGRNRPGIDACATRSDGNIADAHHRREDEQMSLRLHMDLQAADRQIVIDLRLDDIQSIAATRTRSSIRKGVRRALRKREHVPAESGTNSQSSRDEVCKQDLFEAGTAIGDGYGHIHI